MAHDLEVYKNTLRAIDVAWVETLVWGVLLAASGVVVLLLSGQNWALIGLAVLALPMALRTRRKTERLQGEASYLHRKWFRRGHVFMTNGRAVYAAPKEFEDDQMP